MDSDYFHYYASNEHFDMHYVKKIIAVDVYIDSPIVKFVGDITKNREGQVRNPLHAILRRFAFEQISVVTVQCLSWIWTVICILKS